MNLIKNVLILLLCVLSTSVFGQYAVGDFGSTTSGNYNSSTVWSTWNGAAWVAVPGGATPGVNYPDKTTNVFILAGRTVVMNISNLQCKTLYVEAGGKIWTNSAGNLYLNIHGDIVCNGIIGNGATFDGLSLGIESASCTATGTGTFDVSRIRKNTNTNLVSVFNINRDINIRFNASSQVQIYNNNASGTTRFEVNIAVGCTLNLTSSGALTGNAAIDGDIVSGGATQSSGSFTINGTMIVSGTTYFSTNNTSVSLAGYSTTAGSTTVTGPTGSLTVGSTLTGVGTLAGAFPAGTVITSLSPFTVSNAALISGSGNINFGAPCSWTINNGGVLKTAQVSTAYTNVNCTTNSTTTVTTSSTAGLTVGSGISGNGIPANATITAILSGTTFTISSPATLSATNSMNFYGGTGGHMLRIMPGGTLDITGTSGFNFALPTTNFTWDVQNGSYTEYSALGTQNIPCIPGGNTSLPFGNGTNYYGYLKISGTNTKTVISGNLNIQNDLNIVNTTGSPVLNPNNITIQMLGGNWYNYNTSGYTESLTTVVFAGSNVQTINTPGGERFFRITFQKTLNSMLQFNCPINIVNLLSWALPVANNGPVFLNGNRLIIENASNAAIVNAGAAKYIISETTNNTSIIQWNIGTIGASSLSYTFPFGKPGVPDYIPFTYTVAPGTIVGNLSVATYGTPPDNLPWPVSPYNVNNLNSTTGLLPDNRDATVDRFWEIDVTAATPPSAQVTFTYASSELPVAPFNNMALMQGQWYNPGTNKWIPPMSGQTTGTYSTTVPAVTDYGAWTLAAITSPLPVKLLSFSATPNDNIVDLTWSTATEINNDYFTIERGINGRDFSPIENIKGAGNSTIIRDYATIDAEPLPGISYYRLKQTDFDGTVSYSNTVAVRFSSDHKFIVQAGPVPATDKIKLTCFGTDIFIPELYQSDGRLVKQFKGVSEGLNELDISDISKGIYILRINSDLGQKSLRIVKE